MYDPEEEKVLIGTRQQEPHSGDWVIGGRMRAGESLEAAAERNVKRELKIEIDQNRLRGVGDYELIWDARAQPTDTNEEGEPMTGCHMSSKLELYPVTPEEKKALRSNEEYSSLEWVSPHAITDAPEGEYHPCLVDMLEDGLDVITDPGEPANHEEHILRTVGTIAHLKAKLEDLKTPKH